MNALLKFGMHLDYCPCYIPEGNWSDNHHHTKTLDDFDIVQLFDIVKKDGFSIWTVKCTCGFYKAQETK